MAASRIAFVNFMGNLLVFSFIIHKDFHGENQKFYKIENLELIDFVNGEKDLNKKIVRELSEYYKNKTNLRLYIKYKYCYNE